MSQDQTPSSTMPPLVSVVIPTCNRRDLLERCLHALTIQTHGHIEIIVIDDASTDDTPQFMNQFIDQHPSLTIHYLRNKAHAGANPSRNRGILAATGTFIAFEDSDCIAEPNWIENLLRGFTSDQVVAVVGLVKDPPPTNIYELAFRGTHRVTDSAHARRLVGGNMCLRRTVLLDFMVDEDRAAKAVNADGTVDVSVSGRGDEEGLYLMLKAAGHEIRTAPDAAVLHEHHYNRRSFFRQAFRGGQSAAKLVYKYYLRQRLDLLPFILGYLSLPLLLADIRLALIPAFFFAAAVAAIAYNDIARKGKTLGETIRSFPTLIAYYHVRLIGYVTETVKLRIGKHTITRQRLNKL
jgi:glycosyltransferase involved in cell wall biosynthesis